MREANNGGTCIARMDDRVAQVTLRTGMKEWLGGRDYEHSPICQHLGDTGISDLTSAKLEGMLAVMAPPNSFVCLKEVVMMIFDYLLERAPKLAPNVLHPLRVRAGTRWFHWSSDTSKTSPQSEAATTRQQGHLKENLWHKYRKLNDIFKISFNSLIISKFVTKMSRY